MQTAKSEMKLLSLQEFNYNPQSNKQSRCTRRSVAQYKQQVQDLSKSFSVLDSANRQQAQNTYLLMQKKFQEVYQLSMRISTFEGTLGYYEGEIYSIFKTQQKQFDAVYIEEQPEM